MKKLSFGLAAMVLAISLSAFTHVRSEKKFTNYWFPYDITGTSLQSTPVLHLSDDFGCPNNGVTKCAQAFISYTLVGGQYVAGTPVSPALIDRIRR